MKIATTVLRSIHQRALMPLALVFGLAGISVFAACTDEEMFMFTAAAVVTADIITDDYDHCDRCSGYCGCDESWCDDGCYDCGGCGVYVADAWVWYRDNSLDLATLYLGDTVEVEGEYLEAGRAEQTYIFTLAERGTLTIEVLQCFGAETDLAMELLDEYGNEIAFYDPPSNENISFEYTEADAMTYMLIVSNDRAAGDGHYNLRIALADCVGGHSPDA